MSDYPFEPVTNFGTPDVDGDCTVMLTTAASAKNLLYLGPQVWKWTGTIPSSLHVTWLVDPAATFPYLPTVGPYGQTNLESLGGRIYRIANASITNQGIRYGDGNPWPENYRPFSVAIAEFGVTSPTGQIASAGFSRASDSPSVNQGTIGGEFIGVNDDETFTKPVFGAYLEGWRTSDIVGSALTIEAEAINKGNAQDLNPWTERSISSKDTISYVAASGGGDILGVASASAGMAIWNNGAHWLRGIVGMAGSLDPAGSLEFIAIPNTYRVAWHSPLGGLIAWDQADTGQRMSQANADYSGYTRNVKRRKANNTSATSNLDRISRDEFYGYTGTGDYSGAYIQVLQRTNFSGGNARFSCDISAKNGDGSDSQVTLNGLAERSFSPYPANTISLGDATFDFTEIHARRHYYSATVFDSFGSGSPEGNLAASKGSTFRRTNGGAGSCFYVKESGTGNTGWVAK